MKSKVTLYYQSLINKEKNFVLDNQDGTSALETYLASLTSESINEFQYVKQGLSVSIKINKNQVSLDMINSKDLNYVKIQNYDVVNNVEVLEKAYYYFVIAKNWKAKDTIEIVLSMDTLNTFRFNYDYRINKKTITKRMHKDRFSKAVTQFQISYLLSIDMTQDLIYTGYLRDQTNVNIKLENIRFVYDGSKIIVYPIDPVNNAKEVLWFLDKIGLHTIEVCDTSNVIKAQGYTISSVYQYLYRNIDFKSEDISAPVYKKEEHNLYEQEGNFRNSWVLYYKNKDNQDNSPIECYLTADRYLQFLTETGSNTIDVNDIPVGKIFIVSPYFQGEVDFEINGNIYHVRELPNQWRLECIGLENNNGVLIVHIYSVSVPYYPPAVNNVTELETITNPNQVAVTTALDELKVRQVDEVLSSYGVTSPDNPFYHDDTYITLAPLITRTIADSSTIDKTLSENLKIINIPYCPSQISKNEDKYIIEPIWKYDAVKEFFKLVDFSSFFQNSITTDVDDILNAFTSGIVSPNQNMPRTIVDSKLYHSDYYRPKFVYDSFSRIFPLEQLDYGNSILNNPSTKFKFTFIMSRNIVSKFLFKFDFIYKHSNEDYPNVVAVARNNEEVLYNSAYLNYVRTGYNYDLKAKERSETASGVGIGLNIAGLIASIGLSFIPGGQAFGVAGAIGAGLGLAGQIVNYAKTISQNEENIQRKLQETQRQAVSVLNADDYDLLQAYTDNKAKLCLYEVSDNMKKVLDDLFYYCGYIVNEQTTPNIYSRYWFNFVQASLVINDSSNLTSEIEDDIKEKFEQGVTFLHYHNKFDFNQEMENWETSLL